MTVTLLRITLSLNGPWAVGAMNDWRADADLPIVARLDGSRRSPHLPATSLVGSLRAHLTACHGHEFAETWLGPEPSISGGPRLRSPLRFLGVLMGSPGAIDTATTTAIDPVRRAAAGNTLRTAERVDNAGTTSATMYARADTEVPQEVLDALRCWRPYVGRGRSVGLGAAEVVRVEALQLNMRDRGDLTWWFTRRAEWLSGGEAAVADRVLEGRLADDVNPSSALTEIEYRFRLRERLAVGSGDVDEPDHRPGHRQPRPRAVRTSIGRPVVPGTSWKGIFRHRCQHILVAIGCDAATVDAMISALFGSPRTLSPGFRGLLRFSDSFLTNEDGTIVERKHVAIDRFTGGALKGGHFSVNAVQRGAEVTCRIESDTQLPQAVRSLIDAVACDLHEGLIGVGGLTTRGYGTVEMADPSQVPALRVDRASIESATALVHHALHDEPELTPPRGDQ